MQRQKKREEQVARFLTMSGTKFECEVSVSFCGKANRKYARVDFVIYDEDRVVCLEVDENQRDHYDVSCDAARVLNITADHLKRSPLPLHFVRFNPDVWSRDGIKQKMPLDQRHSAMLQVIMHPVQNTNVTYLFYDSQDGVPCVVRDPV